MAYHSKMKWRFHHVSPNIGEESFQLHDFKVDLGASDLLPSCLLSIDSNEATTGCPCTITETMSWLQFGHVGTDLVIQSTGQIIGNHLSQNSMKGKFGNSTWWVMTVSKVANKLKVVFLDSYALVWHHIRSSIFDGVTARRSHQFQSLKTGALTESLHCMSLLCSDRWAIITSSVDPTIDEIQYDVLWG